jgi:hypothetical protein
VRMPYAATITGTEALFAAKLPDNAGNMRELSQWRGKVLEGDMEGVDLSASLGDDRGILPYTVIVNRQGKIASSIFGRINKDALEQMVEVLL